ncbi:hypothetical protein [Rhodococcus sp. BE178]|uniref:hypothetical protein n=1 Tax=Rhodococcus sp. BE178 TaxID=2817737 RepID=UPI003D239B25
MSDSTREQLMDLLEALDGGDYADIADAILAALHPEVATIEEASQLLEGTVISDRAGVGEIRSARGQLWIWWIHGDRLWPLDTIALPATILYRPEVEEAR